MIGAATKLMHAKNAAGDTLFRSQYTYDISGNRITAKLTQAPVSQGSSSDNVLSQRNTYDALDRLTGTQVGSLDGSGNIPSPDRSDSWNLDLLGNWVGTSGGAAAGRVTTIGSGTTSFGYGVDQRNRMTAVTTGTSSGTTTKGVRYDPAGNLQFDGTYYYQYDAWNRLIQVNLGYWDNDTGGQDTGTIAIGALVKNYAFDGLGRLARTVSPYPNPAAAGGFNRTERFYYDGIRRIQEVYTDPVASAAEAGASGNAELEQLANQTTPPNGDTQGTPLGLETGQLVGSTPIQPTPWLEREYVWGPGDGPGGIDELLVQYDNQRNPWWVIQDEGGDVAALCDLGAVNQDGRVASQYTYDAYGSPLSFDSLHAHPLMHCGHKGLFVDRLDGGVVAVASGPERHRLEVGARIICHNRNRTYAPGFGRFLQQDPNASGSVVACLPAMHGQSMGSGTSPFDLEQLFTDGANLFECTGSSPWNRRDPMGLNWVEDYSDVILPIVSMFDGMEGPPALDPLLQLLAGYQLLIQTHRLIQGAAFDEEDKVDWTSDWSRSDDELVPRPKNDDGLREADIFGLDDLLKAGTVKGVGIARALGRKGERAAVSRGVMKLRRFKGDTTISHIRFRHNGLWAEGARVFDGRSGRWYVEVKTGVDRITQRVRIQILKDAALVRQGRSIRWHLFSVNGKKPPSELITELRNAGIQVSTGKL